MSSTKAVGIRVPVDLLEKAKKDHSNFSAFIRRALREKYDTIEDKIDLLLDKLENDE